MPGSFLYVGSAVLLALLLGPWLNKAVANQAPLHPRAGAFLVAGFTLFYAILGFYFTKAVGPHSGDENHYLIQARSLVEDGDLDLRNQLQEIHPGRELTPELRIKSHITPYSNHGRLYSWHSPGLSFLLAPVEIFGVAARHMMLGLLAALGCGAIFAVTRRLSGRDRLALSGALLYGLSLFPVVYACRALPEAAGASLIAWAAWAFLAADEKPRTAFTCMLVCAGYLPWLHSRFIPLSGILAGGFFLRVASGTAAVRDKTIRLVLFTALYAAALFLFGALQFHFFEHGLPLPSGMIILSYPMGMVWSIASSSGWLQAMPLAAWLLPALAASFAGSREARALAILVAALYAANLVFATSNPFYDGGSCFPGRYHLCMTAVLMPFGLRQASRCGQAGRLWFLLLASLGLVLLAPTFWHLPELAKAFSAPFQNLHRVSGWWQGLWLPWPALQPGAVHAGPGSHLALLLALVLMLASAWWGRPRESGRSP